MKLDGLYTLEYLTSGFYMLLKYTMSGWISNRPCINKLPFFFLNWPHPLENGNDIEELVEYMYNILKAASTKQQLFLLLGHITATRTVSK